VNKMAVYMSGLFCPLSLSLSLSLSRSRSLSLALSLSTFCLVSQRPQTLNTVPNDRRPDTRFTSQLLHVYDGSSLSPAPLPPLPAQRV